MFGYIIDLMEGQPKGSPLNIYILSFNRFMDKKLEGHEALAMLFETPGVKNVHVVIVKNAELSPDCMKNLDLTDSGFIEADENVRSNSLSTLWGTTRFLTKLVKGYEVTFIGFPQQVAWLGSIIRYQDYLQHPQEEHFSILNSGMFVDMTSAYETERKCYFLANGRVRSRNPDENPYDFGRLVNKYLKPIEDSETDSGTVVNDFLHNLRKAYHKHKPTPESNDFAGVCKKLQGFKGKDIEIYCYAKKASLGNQRSMTLQNLSLLFNFEDECALVSLTSSYGFGDDFSNKYVSSAYKNTFEQYKNLMWLLESRFNVTIIGDKTHISWLDYLAEYYSSYGENNRLANECFLTHKSKKVQVVDLPTLYYMQHQDNYADALYTQSGVFYQQLKEQGDKALNYHSKVLAVQKLYEMNK